jgi:hypothetical protein
VNERLWNCVAYICRCPSGRRAQFTVSRAVWIRVVRSRADSVGLISLQTKHVQRARRVLITAFETTVRCSVSSLIIHSCTVAHISLTDVMCPTRMIIHDVWTGFLTVGMSIAVSTSSLIAYISCILASHQLHPLPAPKVSIYFSSTLAPMLDVSILNSRCPNFPVSLG